MERSRTVNTAVFLGILSLALGTGSFLFFLRFGERPHSGRQTQAKLAALPRVTLWAWERPEFFGGMSRDAAAIAYLDQTIEVSAHGVASRPRLQPVTFPAGGVRMAVVRIESTPDADLSTASVRSTVKHLLTSATQPGIAGFQVDYDARKSEREFYRAVLIQLRNQMPDGLPFSITALASWCAYDDWIRGLPIDEAVPMFFRMEPDWRRAAAQTVDERSGERQSDFKLREPLCGGSIGLSMREQWPPITDGRRLYLFADSGWSSSAIQSALTRTH